MFQRLGFFFLSFLLAAPLASSEEASPAALTKDFKSELRLAMQHYQTGQYDKSDHSFRDLMEKHTQEWVIYDLYVKTLEHRGEYNKALHILQKAKKKQKDRKKGKQLETRIQQLVQRKQFAIDIQSISPYDDLRRYGTEEFTVRTNIPKKYDAQIESHISEIFNKEKNILVDLLGDPFPLPSNLQVLLIGRFEDFKAVIDNRAPVKKIGYETTYYDDKANELIIYFDGDADWFKAASGIAHHLIKQHYIRSPSLFILTGLSQYVALQLMEEPSVRNKYGSTLHFLDWSYGVGKWANFEEIISLGSRLEAAQRNIPVFRKMAEMRQIFESTSWSLTHFLIESANAEQRKVFLNYINFERSRSFNFCNNFLEYLKENLSNAQWADLDQKWKMSIFALKAKHPPGQVLL